MPAKFTDAEGREWPLKRITVGALDELAELGLDVEAVSEDLDRLGPLVGRPRTFAAVLWWFVGEAVEQAELTVEDFRAALDGDALARAVTAVGVALVDFFPLPPAEKAALIARLTAAPDGSGGTPSSSAAPPASTPVPSPSPT